MNLKRSLAGVVAAAAAGAAALTIVVFARPSDPLLGFPRVVVWAWERREDLRWLDPKEAGVAFLSRTVWLNGGAVWFRPRLSPLQVPPGTALMAVVRVESGGKANADTREAAEAIAEPAWLEGVRALQVDFDAVESERPFYRAVLGELRRRMPEHMPLSITALASWCGSDSWMDGLPVAEAVPMLFRMGPERYSAGSDFGPRLCRASLGISTDEPLQGLPGGRRMYIFRPGAWTQAAFQSALREARRWQ
jgi:hypothetical protein